MKRLLFGLILISSIPSAEAFFPSSLKILGRGLIDVENGITLQLACTGGWDEERPETTNQEPDCTKGRFVLLSANADPSWVGPEIQTSEHHPDIIAALKAKTSGADDYALHAVFKKRKNSSLMKYRYRMKGQWLVPVLAFGIATPFLWGMVAAYGAASYATIKITYGILVLMMGGSVAPLPVIFGEGLYRGARNALSLGHDWNDSVQNMSLKEIANRDAINWSLRPKKLSTRAFRVFMNALTADDTEIARHFPGSMPKFGEVETVYENGSEREFFASAGATPNGNGFSISFLDRNDKGPAECAGARKREIDWHYAWLEARSAFLATARSGLLHDPSAAERVRFTVKRISEKNARKPLFLVRADWIAADGAVLMSKGARGRNAFNILRSLAMAIDAK